MKFSVLSLLLPCLYISICSAGAQNSPTISGAHIFSESTLEDIDNENIDSLYRSLVDINSTNRSLKKQAQYDAERVYNSYCKASARGLASKEVILRGDATDKLRGTKQKSLRTQRVGCEQEKQRLRVKYGRSKLSVEEFTKRHQPKWKKYIKDGASPLTQQFIRGLGTIQLASLLDLASNLLIARADAATATPPPTVFNSKECPVNEKAFEVDARTLSTYCDEKCEGKMYDGGYIAKGKTRQFSMYNKITKKNGCWTYIAECSVETFDSFSSSPKNKKVLQCQNGKYPEEKCFNFNTQSRTDYTGIKPSSFQNKDGSVTVTFTKLHETNAPDFSCESGVTMAPQGKMKDFTFHTENWAPQIDLLGQGENRILGECIREHISSVFVK